MRKICKLERSSLSDFLAGKNPHPHPEKSGHELSEEHSVTHRAIFLSLKCISRNSALLSCIQCHLLVPAQPQRPLRYKSDQLSDVCAAGGEQGKENDLRLWLQNSFVLPLNSNELSKLSLHPLHPLPPSWDKTKPPK